MGFDNTVLNSPDAAACLRCSIIAVKPLRIVAIFLWHIILSIPSSILVVSSIAQKHSHCCGED